MSPMSAIDSLRDRIERLLEESRSRHAGPGRARRGPAATEETRDRFDVLARLWLEDFVVPRMTMLADSFPNSKPVQCALSDRRISLRLDRSQEFPAQAGVAVAIEHDLERVRVAFQASIEPMSADYQRQSAIEFELASPDDGRLEMFVEDRLLQFVSDYLRVRESQPPAMAGKK